MKKYISLLMIAFVLFNFSAKADEGMWIISLLNKNYADMKKQGFKLTPEDIYSLNHASIKDAIPIFGYGCTSEIVSPNGLLLTNHHCGYGAIQSQSSVEHNYLRDGFWAKSYKDELPIPGLSVRFLVKIEDVTAQINKKLNPKMTEEQRQAMIDKISKKIVDKATKDNNYIASVQSFFNGNSYYLVVYEKYSDVRLVGTPPEMIGKFGYDTDNWVWPRHTGDFSVFRVYMSPDGKPADYSPENVPLKPKYFLPVSLKGVEKGDFTMIVGYPGRTNRYMTSYGIDELINITNTNRIKIRGIRQEIMMADMKADEKVRIQYSSKFARSSNYWKNSIGMNRGLKKLNVRAKKQATEEQFMKWYSSDPKLQAKYGEALTLIKNAYQGRKEYVNATQYISETMIRGIEIYYFAKRIADMLDKTDEAKAYATNFYKNYNMPTDKKIASVMLKLFNNDVAEKYHPTFFSIIKNQYKNDFEKYVDDLYANSIFASQAKFDEFMKNPSKENLAKDPAYIAAKSIYEKYDELRAASKKYDENLAKGRRLYLAGLMEMQKDKLFYPDANFTMRLTYGKVGDYRPRDGVIYDYYTTLAGVMEKEIPGDFEFSVPEKLKELYNKKDYGPYADKDGKMHVCFISNNDITGGNSGSPIMNGNGELIGLAFDGNWEAMSGDIAFEPELQRTINVDIRYVLFIMDKLGGAKHLIDEMTIVK